MLAGSRTSARSCMHPPQQGQVSTTKPRVRRMSRALGQYRQRAPVRAGLVDGCAFAAGAVGASVGAPWDGGMTSGRQGAAGASIPL